MKFSGGGNVGDSVSPTTIALAVSSPRSASLGSTAVINGVQGLSSYGTPSQSLQRVEENSSNAVKLPKISLPLFNGNIKLFFTFLKVSTVQKTVAGKWIYRFYKRFQNDLRPIDSECSFIIVSINPLSFINSGTSHFAGCFTLNLALIVACIKTGLLIYPKSPKSSN